MHITNIKNYFYNDHLLDWLNIHSTSKYNSFKTTNYQVEHFLQSFSDNLINYTISYIFSKLIYNNYSISKLLSTVSNELSINDRIRTTKQYIDSNIPIIFNPHLGNINELYGSAAFIVRCDYIHLFSNIFNDSNISSNIHYQYRKNKSYFLIDIKNIKINIDTFTINNTYKNQYHRASSHLFNQLLNNYLNTNIDTIYFIIKTNNSSNNDYVILSDLNDENLRLKTELAIQNYNYIHLYGSKWDPIYDSKNNSLLLPNLCNYDDHPWNNTKLFIANQIKDITLLWNCSSINRNKAFQNNIYTYDDPKLNSSILGKTGKQAIILDKIIDINRQDVISYSPRKIKNYQNIKVISNQQTQFIVDFETTTIHNSSIIFLIGCICFHSDNTYSFKSFLSKDFNIEENEHHIIYEWLDYMNSISNNIIIHHWGNAEPTTFNHIINKYSIDSNLISNIQWNDILNMFKKEPFVIKNVFSFGLKEICKELYALGLINNIWDDNDIDGKTTMVYVANEIKNNINHSNIHLSFKENKIIKTIIQYNKIDCLVLYDILHFFKTITNST